MGRALVALQAKHSTDWAARCRHWADLLRETAAGPLRQRRVLRSPLILTGHGVHLRVHRGALVVRNGFTHYPQEMEEQRFFPGARDLPSRIIAIDGSGSLSFDVLSWLAEQGVPLIKVDWRGSAICVVGANYASDEGRISEQLDALRKGQALSIGTSLVRLKLLNSIGTLRVCIPPNARLDQALVRLNGDVAQIDSRPPKSPRQLLGIEGRAAYAYFGAWHSLPLKWTGIGRRPIPPQWHAIGSRQSGVGNKIGNRNGRASHPMNAMLNYAYTILESQVRMQVLAEGYDPKIGFLHARKANRDAFVLDLMEPMRPIVDRAILQLVQGHTFHPADFPIRNDGVCRLNPEVARYVVKLTLDQLTRPTLRQYIKQIR